MERSFLPNVALKRIIEKKCVSQTKLAVAAGMRMDTLSRIVNSQRPLYADEVVPLCEALGIPVNELFIDCTKNN